MTHHVFHFHADPGHGWCAVKRDLLDKLGIAQIITPYSYQRGKTVYLEEDCDYSTLIGALKTRGDTWALVESHTNRQSPIRSYEGYRPSKPASTSGGSAMTETEKQTRIANMMTGLRLRALNPGPRSFPEYRTQSTYVYVMQYQLMNGCYACWKESEIDCALHLSQPNR